MNIFLGLIGVQEFFSFNFPLREYFFCTFSLQARNVTTNVPKILDLKSSSEQMFPEN